MNLRTSIDSGKDVFLRLINRGISYAILCLSVSIFSGIFSAVIYASYVLQKGTISALISYPNTAIRSKVLGDSETGVKLDNLEQLISSQSHAIYDAIFIGFGASLVVLGFLLFMFRKIGERHLEDTHLRGSKILAPKELENQIKKASRFGFGYGFDLGKDAPQIYEEYVWRSLAIIGRPGTGKSNLIRRMLEQDLDRNAKCFIVDIDGAYWRRFGRPGKDKILSLRHKDSEYWDFKSEDVVPSLFASYLVAKGSTGPSFWWKAARGVLKSLLEHSSDLEDFKKKIAQSDGDILKLLKDKDELVGKVLGKEGSQQAAGVLGNTVLDFGFLNDLGYWPKKCGKDKPFSIVNWAADKDDTSWVYVVVNEDEIEEVKPLIGCWFNLAINGCFRRDEEAAYDGQYPSLRIVLDELKSLGKLEELEKAGERLRKYRASLIVGYQNNAQLDSIYGQKGAENIKDVLQNKVIFSVGDPAAQHELSRLLGEEEIEEKSANVSYDNRSSGSHSESHRINRRSIVLPSELGKLADFECYMKIGSFDPARCRIDFKKFPNKNPPLEWELPPKKDSREKSDAKVPTEGNSLKVGEENSEASSATEKAKKVDDEIDIEMDF